MLEEKQIHLFILSAENYSTLFYEGALKECSQNTEERSIIEI